MLTYLGNMCASKYKGEVYKLECGVKIPSSCCEEIVIMMPIYYNYMYIIYSLVYCYLYVRVHMF